MEVMRMASASGGRSSARLDPFNAQDERERREKLDSINAYIDLMPLDLTLQILAEAYDKYTQTQTGSEDGIEFLREDETVAISKSSSALVPHPSTPKSSSALVPHPSTPKSSSALVPHLSTPKSHSTLIRRHRP